MLSASPSFMLAYLASVNTHIVCMEIYKGFILLDGLYLSLPVKIGNIRPASSLSEQ